MKFVNLIFCLLIFNINFLFAKNKIPEWYYDKPEDVKLYIYSVSKGKNLQTAINDALNNIYLNVYNKINNTNIVNDDDVSNRKININFSNYVIEKNVNVNNVSYVLINLKRNELFEKQLNDINFIDTDITNKYSAIIKENIFIKIHKLNEILSLIDNVNEKIQIIKTIDNFNDTKLQKKYSNIKKDFDNIFNNISVSIELPEDLLNLYDILKENLAINNISINKNSLNNLTIKQKTITEKIHNTFVVKTIFVCELKNKNNLILYKTFDYTYTTKNESDIIINKNITSFINDLKNNKIDIINIITK